MNYELRIKNYGKSIIMNIFHKIDDWFEKTKKLIKEKTRLDFFDWSNLFLFIVGIIFIA